MMRITLGLFYIGIVANLADTFRHLAQQHPSELMILRMVTFSIVGVVVPAALTWRYRKRLETDPIVRSFAMIMTVAVLASTLLLSAVAAM